MTPATTRSGHVIAWAAFLLGTLVSIAANVLDAASDTWTAPELIGAGFWPLALLLSVEVLTRVVWPRNWYWWVARVGGVGLVALVAFVLSYRHMADLLTSWGEDQWNAHLGPLAVDGLMLVSATALLAISRAKQTTVAERWDRPHVFTWPEPIGPELSLDMEWARVAANGPTVQRVAPPPMPDVVPRRVTRVARPVQRRPGRALASRRKAPAVREPWEILAENRPVPPPAPPQQQPAPAPTKPAAKPKPSASNVSEEEAYQRWIAAPADQKPSAQEVARIAGLSKATAARRIQAWRQTQTA